ncbi:cation-translocating P-type ATPase [Saccharopolyspora mangrovi]|uniref:Cation-translocating P-type ATPase n=1 Tax=Saccharopolyspora mangrovi TaxID=3082379 RepID=A0ABU6A4H6_9PSEU|nr:cation-translocating P-type ATPase [Saccharopolyspora sp. S2-29]MEB3366319.1 cation-translocating P-type ATPase [Saccharopolyspora sp. S2-29]
MLRWLLSQAAEVAAPVLHAARGATSASGDRRVWRGRERSHLELRGAHLPANEAAAREAERRLGELAGVRRAEVNGVLGRVVIEHAAELPDLAEPVRVIGEVETEFGLDDQDVAPRSDRHPGNAEAVLRDAGALAISALGLGYAGLGALLPARLVSPLLPAAVSLVDTVPWMRRGVQQVVGRAPLDLALALGGAAGPGLSGRPLGALTDLCGRFCTARETIARHQAWQRWEAVLPHACPALPQHPRPRAVPDGPVERVANASGGAALGGAVTAFALSRAPQRALAALLAAVPKPAIGGREAFATTVDTSLAARGALVLEPDALRLLDRLDAVVFDAPALLSGRRAVDSVIPLEEGGDSAQLFARAAELVDPTDPTEPRSDGAWSVTPLAAAEPLPPQARRAASAEIARGSTVLALVHDGRAVALAVVVDELDPLAEALVDTAREVASTVLVAGAGLERRLAVDSSVPAGAELGESVRALQDDGTVVAVISHRDAGGLAAADLGIGLSTSDPASWAADVICPSAAVLDTLLGSATDARAASMYAAAISAAGALLGALFAAFGPASGSPARASMPVHAATLAAYATGTWVALRASSRPPPLPRERTPWHAMPATTVLSALNSSERGLDGAAAAERHRPHDDGRAPVGVLAASVEGLINPITPVLGAGAVISAGLGSVVDAVLICGVLLASALIDGLQRAATERELSKLLASGRTPARRRRDGSTEVVSADELVPGDVIELRAGDGVPADCRLLSVESLEVDESGLTGESQLITKTAAPTTAQAVADRTCMLYQGTVIASGTGIAVAVAVGTHTELGRTTAQVTGTDEATGVETRLAELTKKVLPISVGAGALLFASDLLRGVPMGQTVARSVGLAVAAVPEGLPFVATLAELAAARRMSRRGVLVRSPATIEALGRVDALCFDKTGTLTQGRIALGEVSDGRGSRGVHELQGEHRQVVAAALRATPRPQDDQPLPHLTDRAVLEGAEEIGLCGDGEVLAELPFEPSRGFHAVHTDRLLSVKGAPEVVLDRCARWRRDGSSQAFDAEARADVEEEVERLALRGFRLLAVAERRVSGDFELTESDVDDLELVGLLGLADPVHATAAAAVEQLERAGVDVIMITGDHPSTAEAIAAELGMLGGKRVITGAQLDDLDDEQLAGEVPKISVFARVTPAQKARIVRCLRDAGRAVAMTGDGANDVPAINLAHVGIAFGSRATAAARDAADLVVADDRIETLTDGIVEGRGMWTSVREALAVLLGGNLGEIGYALGTGLISPSAALNARQLLVVNMLTDVLPSIAIAVRPPADRTPEKLLAEGPEASLGTALAREVGARAVATSAAAGLAWMLTRPVSTAAQARTAGLVALVSAQLAQTLTSRGRTPLVVLAAGGSVLVLLALVQIPGVSQFFGSSPLLPHQWAVALGISVAVAVAVRVWQMWPATTASPAELAAGSPRGHLGWQRG